MRSLRLYPAGDEVRGRLAMMGFAVRDAEQMPGKDRGFFVIYQTHTRDMIIDRGWVPVFS